MRNKIFNLKTFALFFTTLFILFYFLSSGMFWRTLNILPVFIFICFILGLEIMPKNFLFIAKINAKGIWYKENYKKGRKFNEGFYAVFKIFTLLIFILFCIFSLFSIISCLNENPIDFASIYMSIAFAYVGGYFWHTTLKLDGVRKDIEKIFDNEE